MIDFNMYEIDLSANYGGSDQKRGIIYNGEKYMIKMPNRIPNAKRNEFNSSYSNSVFSEHICCEILKNLGFSVQETLLGFLKNKNNEQRPVVACKNFVPKGHSMVDFRAIEDALLLDRKPGKIPRLDDIYKILTIENVYFTKKTGKRALENYWDTFILDAMLGNFDRHANNWAYFIKNGSTELIPTPIFDCGSCLYPQIADDAIPDVLNSETEIQKRIDIFPAAALEHNNEKVNYKKYIISMENPDCTEALLRIYPKLDRNIIKNTIYKNCNISDIRKEFYNTMLQNRIDRILQPAYEKALEKMTDIERAVYTATIQENHKDNHKNVCH